MGNIQDAFYAAIGLFLQRKMKLGEVPKVTHVADPIYWEGCDTCDYGSKYEMEISFETGEGFSHYCYNGSFSDLMRELTD